MEHQLIASSIGYLEGISGLYMTFIESGEIYFVDISCAHPSLPGDHIAGLYRNGSSVMRIAYSPRCSARAAALGSDMVQ